MNVTLETRTPCRVCGYLNSWLKVAGVRVNKHSMRTTGAGLTVGPRACRECGIDQLQDTPPDRWLLDAESLEKVNVSRARRGWEPWSQ